MDYSVEVTSLAVYPVKSLAAIAVDAVELTPLGLAGDRHWMVVMPNGRFVTQRQVPVMATITTGLDDNRLILTSANGSRLEVPVGRELSVRREVMVWRDRCEALDEGDEAAAWLTQALNSQYELRLVRMAEGFTRPQGKPDLLGEQTSTLFADAAPYLIANEASLEALNRQLLRRQLEAVDMRRFRPNIVVRGLAAFAEHSVGRYRHREGLYSLANCYPSERCVVTTIDQDTGVKHPDMEPFNTLLSLNPKPGKPQVPAFAENAVLVEGAGQVIRVGDRLVASAR